MKEKPFAHQAGGSFERDAVAQGIKYPAIKVQLTGGDGNAFAVMGAVTKAMRRAGIDSKEIDAFRAEAMSGDYDKLLATAMKWVDVS